MSYRVETEPGGLKSLVIDGWEKGIADSPYQGIASMKNVNCSWLPGATYVNYKRQAMTISGGTMAAPVYYCAATGTSSGTYYILDSTAQVWIVTNGGTTATLLTGNTTGTGKGKGIAYWQNYLFVFGTTFIDVCGDGTGVGGITSANWTTSYLTNVTGRSITAHISAGNTSFTLSAAWTQPSGVYETLINAGSQYVQGTYTHGSTAVTFSPPANATNAATTVDIHIFPQVARPASAYEHQSLIGYDDVLYFCNGTALGSILAPTGQFFSASSFNTVKFNYAAITISLTDIANWIVNLGDSILIGGNNAIYPWGAFRSPQPTNFDIPIPSPENISRMINIMNVVYVFSGNKGNIYQTNGYSLTIFKKIPDSFLGTVDPNWNFGGVMFHRNKLFFGASGLSNGGATAISGVFSLTLLGGSTQFTFETAGALTFEAQNSYGATPTTAFDATNILIDNNYNVIASTTSEADSYISAWFNNTVGGVDYNTTTLWNNHEPSVESDLIPCGIFLQATNFENVEYKLDRPMMSGDEIKLYYRTSFNSSYTLMGTSTASSGFLPLSDNFNSNIALAQWVQLKATFKCASSSSFLPQRELRLHFANAVIS